MELRPIVIAYNDFAIAASDDAYLFDQYNLNKDDVTLGLTLQFAVIGSSATDLASKVEALDPLIVNNGTLVIQQARELILDALSSSGGTTLTSGSGFLAAHVGDWIVIKDIGTRRIVSVVSSSSVTVNTAVASGTYRAIKPARLFQGTHADYTFVDGRGALTKISGSRLNTEFSQHYSLTISGRLPKTDCLDDLSVAIVYDASRRRTATLRGKFLVCDTNDDGTVESAQAVFDAKITTLVTNHLAGFGGLSAYELVSETQRYDAAEDIDAFAGGAKVQKNFSFTRIYLERFVSDATAIIDQRLSVTRNQPNTHHGMPSRTGVVTVTVQYGCNVDHDVKTLSGLRSLYVGTIRSLIRKAVENSMGDSSGIIENEQVTIDQSLNTISARMTILLRTSSSIVLSIAVTTTIARNLGLTAVPLWDGKDDTYAIWKNAGTRTRVTIVTVRSFQPIKFQSQGGFVSATDPAIKLNLGIAEFLPSGDLAKLNIQFVKGKSEKGSWMQNGEETVRDGNEHVGATVDAPFNLATIYEKMMTRNDLWVVKATPIVPTFKAPPLTGLGEITSL